MKQAIALILLVSFPVCVFADGPKLKPPFAHGRDHCVLDESRGIVECTPQYLIDEIKGCIDSWSTALSCQREYQFLVDQNNLQKLSLERIEKPAPAWVIWLTTGAALVVGFSLGFAAAKLVR